MNELLAIAIVIVIAVFLVIRELWTWYWKINEALGPCAASDWAWPSRTSTWLSCRR